MPLTVGRFSADYHWPVLGDYRGQTAAILTIFSLPIVIILEPLYICGEFEQRVVKIAV